MKMRHKRRAADARRRARAWQCTNTQRWRRLALQGWSPTGRNRCLGTCPDPFQPRPVSAVLTVTAAERGDLVAFVDHLRPEYGQRVKKLWPIEEDPHGPLSLGEWFLTPGETRTHAGGTVSNAANLLRDETLTGAGADRPILDEFSRYRKD